MRGGERVLQAADTDGVLESGVAAFGQEINLVAQVAQVVVDGRGGEQQDFRFDTFLDDIVHQTLIAAFADEDAFFITRAGCVVAKVVRLINDDEVEVAPIKCFQIYVAGKPVFAAQVGVRKDGVGKPVFSEGIEKTVVLGLINSPVLLEFFWAKNQHTLVFQLKVFDDGQRLESFSQADAIGKDAAIVFENFIDRAFHAVALELKTGFPNLRVHDFDVLVKQPALFLIGEKIFKDVEQRLVINKFRRVILVKLAEVLEDFRLHVFHECRVIPQFIKPYFQVAAVAIAVHFQVEFDVIAARAQPKTAHREIGTAENRLLHARVGDVIHLSMKKLRVPDRTNVHLLPHPFGAVAGDTLLFKAISEL